MALIPTADELARSNSIVANEREINELIRSRIALQAQLNSSIDASAESHRRVASAASNAAVKVDAVDNSVRRLTQNRADMLELSDIFNKFLLKADTLTQPVFDAASRLESLAAERRAVVSELSQELGGSARLFTLFATDARSAVDQLVSVNQDALGKLRGMYDIYGDSASEALRNLNGVQAEFIADTIRTDKVFLGAQAAMTTFWGQAAGFKEENGQLVADSFFRIQGVPIMDIMGGVASAFEPITNILKDESLRRPFTEDMLQPEQIEDTVKKLKSFATAIKGLGMTSNDIRELVRQNFIRTGEATTDLFDTVVKASSLGQHAFGINANLIASDINKMMQNSDLFGFRTADDFAKISARIHDVHMSVDQLQTVMGRFNTFESAASTVSQLNAALNTNFDAMELMSARYDDPVHFIELLREGLNSTGKSFAELPLAYQNMLTQQLSLSAEAIAGIQDRRVRTAEELTAAQEKQNAAFSSQKDAQASLDADLEMRVNVIQEGTKSLKDMASYAERAVKMQQTVGLEIAETATRAQDQINKIANTYVTKMGQAYDSIVEAIKVGDTKLVESGLAVTKQALETQLPPMVSRITKTFVDEYLKSLESGLTILNDPARAGKILESVRTSVTPTPAAAPAVPTTPADDIVVKGNLSEGDRVILAQYGELSAYKVDARDDIKASPPAEVKTAPTPEPINRPAPISTLPNAVQASLQGVGTSLRIELDIGQLTDMILRDIMMNKSAVFGGVGG